MIKSHQTTEDFQVVTCNACNAEFNEEAAQKSHYKSERHRYNLRRKVVRCCFEHAESMANTFLTSDVVVVDIKEPELATSPNPMENSGYGY